MRGESRTGRHTALRAESDLRVLWIIAGRSEAALSLGGLWLRRGRRSAELAWTEVQQLQAVPARGPTRGRRAGIHIEVFDRAGGVHVLGPFGRPQAERWVQACVEAAREHGHGPLPLDGAIGFALPA